MITPEFLRTHWLGAAIVAAVCVWISFCLILRMWLVHRSAPVIKKLLWSLMLIVPFFGWLAFGAWFQTLSRHDLQPGRSDPEGGW